MRHLWGTTLPTARTHRERGPGRSQPENEAGAGKRDTPGGAEDTRTPRPGAQNGAGGSAGPDTRENHSSAHGTLVSGHQVDATLVALIPAEGSLEESNDESQDLFLAVLTSTDRHHVCVVMLTS